MVRNERTNVGVRSRRVPGWTTAAGAAGVIGGIAVLAGLWLGETGTLGGVELAAFAALTLALLAVTVVAGHVRFGDEYGPVGTAVAGLLAVDLAYLAVDSLLEAVGALPAVLGRAGEWAFVGMLVLTTLYGAVLWGTTARRWVAAVVGLTAPAVLVLATAFQSYAPAAADLGLGLGIPLAAAYGALGYGLWTAREREAETSEGVTV